MLTPRNKKFVLTSSLIAMGLIMLVLSHSKATVIITDFSSSSIATTSKKIYPESLSESASGSQANILIVGDMMFDRFIRHVNDVHGSNFLFSCIDSLLKNADFALGNLEGPITANPSISEGTVIGSPENYRFTFPPGTADLLLQHNIKVVSIGNNHIGDYGGAGISSTHDYLTRAGVAYFGGLAGDSPVYRTTDHGIDLSFVNFNQFGGDSAEKVAQIISSEHAQNRVVIVYAHWGIEYVDAPQSVRDVARLFANSGANLIIGSHPHITQTHEMIDGTPVYYSLGNFIFDQYFEPNVTKGLALLVHISSKNKITIDEKPVVLNPDGRTCLL